MAGPAPQPASSSMSDPHPIPLPCPGAMASHWALDPSVVFLNHGSFGATPRSVLSHQRAIQDELEAEPVRFIVERLDGLMDEARAALARFIGADEAGLVFVPNASHGVATTLRHIEPTLKPGDELLAAGHEYLACMNQLRALASRTGARVVVARLGVPIDGPDHAADAVLREVTPRTRLLLISHVTSPTATVLPVERLVRELEPRGVACLVDGAHAPGFLADPTGRAASIGVDALGASYYTGNCHKWICSPKGSAFLHVRADRREGLRPLVLSNNAEAPKPGRHHLHTEFDYVGTADPSAWLSVPAAIETMGAMDGGGWAGLIRANDDLARRGADLLRSRLGLEATAPASMRGAMASLVIPAEPDPDRAARLASRPTRYADALQDRLLQRWRIQVPVWSLSLPAGRVRLLRISAQRHNSLDQYEHLARALEEELAIERRA